VQKSDSLDNTLHHTSTNYTTLHHTAPHCTTLQHTAPHYTTLHHTTTQVENGADVNMPDFWGQRPLACAVEGADTTCVQMLVAAGARLDDTSSLCEHTPLHTAVQNNLRYVCQTI